MPNYIDIPLTTNEDGTYRIGIAPPIPIGGFSLQFDLMKRYGGTPIISLYTASGLDGTSGLTIANSGQGIVDIPIHLRSYLSGRDWGNYPYVLRRTDSGQATNFTEGVLVYQP